MAEPPDVTWRSSIGLALAAGGVVNSGSTAPIRRSMSVDELVEFPDRGLNGLRACVLTTHGPMLALSAGAVVGAGYREMISGAGARL